MSDNNVVIDNGGGYIKIGLTSEEQPRGIIPNIFVNNNSVLSEKSQAIYPIDEGIITDWDGMELIWKEAFDHVLKRLSLSSSVLITEPIGNPIENSQMMAQILFEVFNISFLHISFPELLETFSQGKDTAFVCSSGDTVSTYSALMNGYLVKESMIKINIGGRDLTDYLIKILENPFIYQKELSMDIKNKICYVAIDSEKEKHNVQDSTVLLPDGLQLNIKDQKYKASEIFFNPTLLEKMNKMTLVDYFKESIDKVDYNLKRELYKNVIFSGGNTLMAGFKERFMIELRKILPAKVKNIVEYSDNSIIEGICSVWTGGSIYSTINSSEAFWISKQDYEENGACIVQKKKLGKDEN